MKKEFQEEVFVSNVNEKLRQIEKWSLGSAIWKPLDMDREIPVE
jgi:hypothetical protein